MKHRVFSIVGRLTLGILLGASVACGSSAPTPTTPTPAPTPAPTPTPTPSAAPFISATIYSVPSGAGLSASLAPRDVYYLGSPQLVSVCTNSTCATPLTNATVTLNGTSLSYDPLKLQYTGSLGIGLGAPLSLKVTFGGVDYTSGGTQFSQYPTLTNPTPGMRLDAGVDNIIRWTPTPPATATPYFSIFDMANRVVFPSSGKALDLPLGSINYTLNKNWTSTPGDNNFYVGWRSTQPISGAASGSSMTTAIGSVLVLTHTF